MSDYQKHINDALLGANPNIKLREQSSGLIDKWEKTGLLDGITEEYKKSGMAIMLENQAKQLVQENSFSGGNATPGAAGSEEWSGVALPLVRRVFGEIAAQDFVSVQPMNLPSGLVFYLDFKYGSGRMGDAKGESIYGITGKYTPSGSSKPTDGWGSGGLYGAGQYGYSQSSGSAPNDGVLFDVATACTLADVNYNTEVSTSHAGKLFKATSTNVLSNAASLNASNYDPLSIRAWNFASLSGGAEEWTFLPEFASISGDKATVVFYTTGVQAPVASDVACDFMLQPTAADRGDFEDSDGHADDAKDLAIPQIDLQMKSDPIC